VAGYGRRPLGVSIDEGLLVDAPHALDSADVKIACLTPPFIRFSFFTFPLRI
jgi:hypothetical protein